MMKFTIETIEPGTLNADDEELREDKLYYIIEIPETGAKYEIRSVPGNSLFFFKSNNNLPAVFTGLFTSRRFIEEAITRYCSDPKSRPAVQKTPRPVGVTISKPNEIGKAH